MKVNRQAGSHGRVSVPPEKRFLIIFFGDGKGGLLKRRRLHGYRELLGGGGSMYTCPVLEQHVGVPAGGPYTVEVYFPVTGKRVVRSGVTAPQTLTIEEN